MSGPFHRGRRELHISREAIESLEAAGDTRVPEPAADPQRACLGLGHRATASARALPNEHEGRGPGPDPPNCGPIVSVLLLWCIVIERPQNFCDYSVKQLAARQSNSIARLATLECAQ